MTQTQIIAFCIYGTVLVASLALIVASFFLTPTRAEDLLALGGDAFKTSIGALIGAASILMGGRNAT